MRKGTLFAAALALGLASCGAPPREPPPARSQPGTLAVRFEEDLRWPVRLASIHFSADGAPVKLDQAFAAAPGRHLAEVRAEVRWSCTAAGDEAVATVSDVLPIHLGPGGAEVRWALVGVGNNFDHPEQRFRVVRSVAGDARVADVRAPNDKGAAFARCGPAPTVQGAACRVGVMAESARARKDVVDLLCKTEKLGALWALARETDPSVHERAARLEAEADQCVGEDVAYVGPRVQVALGCPDEG